MRFYDAGSLMPKSVVLHSPLVRTILWFCKNLVRARKTGQADFDDIFSCVQGTVQPCIPFSLHLSLAQNPPSLPSWSVYKVYAIESARLLHRRMRLQAHKAVHTAVLRLL